MQLLAKCPKCNRTIYLSLEDADRRKRCRYCYGLFRVPKPEQLSAALEIAESSNASVYVDENGNVYG